jgi:O-6-methylguanine DNA methyltransferase
MDKTFKERVYEVTNKIPAGKVATYGQIAKLAGSPGAARAVGMCMRTNPNIPYTPCHRVVGSDGTLTGYSAKEGLKTKKEMLIKEGVEFKGDKVDLTKSLWNNNLFI